MPFGCGAIPQLGGSAESPDRGMAAARVAAEDGRRQPTQEEAMTDTTAIDLPARVLDAGQGETARFFADEIVVKERRPELDIWQATINAGCEPPLHVHHREDEWLYVVEGRITAFVEGREIEIGPGGLGCLPRGVPHTYAVDTGTARMLVVNTPGGFAGMFADVERALGADVPAAPRPEDGAAMAPVFEAYGIEMVGPNPRYA
jgi:quercetin dioxygenase-like cupin family protein